MECFEALLESTLMSDDEEQPPKALLLPISNAPQLSSTSLSLPMAASGSQSGTRPYQLTFSSREEQIRYIQHLHNSCRRYNGNPDEIFSWLDELDACLVREGYPETDHPFIVRQLLTGETLNHYLIHEDLVFNFCDLRKLFLLKQNTLAPLRTIPSLDSTQLRPLNSIPSCLTSTQYPVTTHSQQVNVTNPSTLSFTQSLEDLTQHDIRKTIIEDLHRNMAKFTGDHRQDVVKWLTCLALKFETAGISGPKRLQLMSQLLDKGALDWFQEHRTKFNECWEDFIAQFKKTFDSPNRARIAMQKLHSYIQSPQQDVRSFCAEMRKLFQEADPQMSSSMKLELLLAKINPTYRLDLLKQKPKDPEDFEDMAKDPENTYLIYDAIDQNSSPASYSSPNWEFVSTNATIPTPSGSDSFVSSMYLPRQPSSAVSPAFQQTRFGLPTNSTSLPASMTAVRPWRPSTFHTASNQRPSFDRYSSTMGSRHNPPTFRPRGVGHNHGIAGVAAIPPLMSIPTSAPPLPSNGTVLSDAPLPLVCQLCNEVGHSARGCHF